MKTCKILSSVILLSAISSVCANEQQCGGILEGDNGKFRYSKPAVDASQNCIWLVRSSGATNLLLTLDRVMINGNGSLILYPERLPGEKALNPIEVRTDAVGEKFNLPGSTVVIIAPQTTSTVYFTWDSESTEDFTDSVTIIADYFETPDGELVWSPRKRQEKLWWIIDLGLSPDDVVDWTTRADMSDCDSSQPCTCLSFEAYEISSEGYLVQIAKVCGSSTNGSFGVQSYPLVIVASANTTKHGASRVELYWTAGEEQAGTTSTVMNTETTPGPPPASHIYFGTEGGGIQAFSLATSTVTTVVNGAGNFKGITYDPVNNKIYYADYGSAQVCRMNTDGSGIETLQSDVDC